MRDEEAVSTDAVLHRALVLAEDFLSTARDEMLELAAGDLAQLHATATALREAAADRSTGPRSAERIAYLVVASAFNRVLQAREQH